MLGSNPDILGPRHWAQEEAKERRRDLGREKGREFSETEGTPRALPGGILSPRGWEMLELDVYERAKEESHPLS